MKKINTITSLGLIVVILAVVAGPFAQIVYASARNFIQGGNSFRTQAILGTNDNFGLSFETNNTERMRVDTSGNLGIGTMAPSYKLDVRGGQINASGGLCIAGDCKTSWIQVQSTPAGLNGHVQFNNGGVFGGDANLFWDNSNKNLGLGTSVPVEKLDVSGGVRLGRSPVPLLTTLMSPMGANDTVANVVSTSGYPTTGTLVINGEAMTYRGVTSTSFTGLTRGVLGTTNVAHPVESTIQNYLQIILADTVTPRMVVTGSGNVGIGTVFPTVKLQVEGGEIRLFSTPGNLASRIFFGGGSGDPGYLQLYSAGVATVQISAAPFDNSYFSVGNVGIGTNRPNTKLQVSNGDAAISTQGNGLILRATDGPNCYRVTVNNSGILTTTLVTCP